SGDSTLITPTASFQSDYRKVMDSIKAAGAKGLLIGAQNVTAIPYLSSGQTYSAIKNTPPSPSPTNFAVGPNCAPRALGGQGDSAPDPFPFGPALIGPAQANPSPTAPRAAGSWRRRSCRGSTRGSERRFQPLRPDANAPHSRRLVVVHDPRARARGQSRCPVRGAGGCSGARQAAGDVRPPDRRMG